jgi:hypothetical protein
MKQLPHGVTQTWACWFPGRMVPGMTVAAIGAFLVRAASRMANSPDRAGDVVAANVTATPARAVQKCFFISLTLKDWNPKPAQRRKNAHIP